MDLEHCRGGALLEDEKRYYESFKGLRGFPEVYWSGEKDDFNVMVFELLGPSLDDLFAHCDCHFCLKITLMLAAQLIARLEKVHSKGLLHRDVKPGNFLFGSSKNGNTVYIIDFGISIDYVARQADKWDGSPPMKSRVVDTTRFASIRAHAGQTQSRKDNLESLVYLLIYFLRGTLPWQGLKAGNVEDKDRLVMEKKTTTSVEKLCAGLPQEFAEYMRMVNKGRTHELRLDHGLNRLLEEPILDKVNGEGTLLFATGISKSELHPRDGFAAHFNVHSTGVEMSSSHPLLFILVFAR
ncbi:casein kinase I [Friedmanniomyces endolithicus]|nr:casein kinase I [Friedmanniomyces endolithicus]